MNFRLIQQALVALEMYRECTPEGNGVAEQAIVALKQFKKEWQETEVPYVVVECNCSGKTTLFSPPQRTEQEQQIETLKRCLFQMQEAAKDLVKQAKSLPSTQRKPLTDEEIGAILEGVNAYGTRLYTFARAIEAKLKEKNTRNGGCL